jgi:hypothetical protein
METHNMNLLNYISWAGGLLGVFWTIVLLVTICALLVATGSRPRRSPPQDLDAGLEPKLTLHPRLVMEGKLELAEHNLFAAQRQISYLTEGVRARDTAIRYALDRLERMQSRVPLEDIIVRLKGFA